MHELYCTVTLLATQIILEQTGLLTPSSLLSTMYRRRQLTHSCILLKAVRETLLLDTQVLVEYGQVSDKTIWCHCKDRPSFNGCSVGIWWKNCVEMIYANKMSSYIRQMEE
jgi:hypothetical protein